MKGEDHHCGTCWHKDPGDALCMLFYDSFCRTYSPPSPKTELLRSSFGSVRSEYVNDDSGHDCQNWLQRTVMDERRRRMADLLYSVITRLAYRLLAVVRGYR